MKNKIGNIALIAAGAAAIIGPLSQHGKANAITVICVVPVVLCGLYLVIRGFTNRD